MKSVESKQINTSFSQKKGTLRGLHYQIDPFQEVKLVRCIQGRIFDVVIDLRPDSPTFLQWDGHELSPENGRMMYVPEGLATGFITLEDNSGINYSTTECYVAGAERGVRYDDPAIGIEWPTEIISISDKDRDRGDFDVKTFNAAATGRG